MALTKLQLLALPYNGSSSFARGLDSASFRAQHEAHGETIRWWRGVEVESGVAGRSRDGRKMVEQDLDNEARFIISNTEVDVESAEFGLIKKGTLQISAFPDWARFNHLDRIALTSPGRILGATYEVTRGSGSEDDLPFTPVASISAVYVAGAIQATSRYEATDTGINWLSNAPSEGSVYFVVYEYYPRYLVLPQRVKSSPTGADGEGLPLTYWLELEARTGQDEILE